MGEGFVVMQSNDVDIYYYQDEPGKLMHTHTHTHRDHAHTQTDPQKAKDLKITELQSDLSRIKEE